MEYWEYCYAVTCDDKISGDCYHRFRDAVMFIQQRWDHPEATVNAMVWESSVHTYKIIPLTFAD